MKYIIDASSLITSYNHRYPPEVFPQLWDKMSEAFKEGPLVSSEIVLVELERGSDDLTKWAKKHKKAFEAVTAPEAVEVQAILKKFPKLVDTSLGNEYADPYLIAKAKPNLQKNTVVTEESKTKQNKIPAVCKAEGVLCEDFISMVKQLGWKF